MEAKTLLHKALNASASDLQLTVGIPPVIRLSGALVKMDLPKVIREETEGLTNMVKLILLMLSQRSVYSGLTATGKEE